MQVSNFMSVQDATLDFSNLGLVLIQGSNADVEIFDSNGAGKSTLFSEAPTWALYGETIRGQKGDAVINRDIGKNTAVSLEIVDDYGVAYTIVRHRKHKDFKNHVHIYCDGQNITPKSDKDADEFIVELLQMDYTTFTNSIMFGQGMTKMFASSTDGEQKKILEKMLQIDIFKDCQDIAKSRLNSLNESLSNINSDIQMLNHSIDSEQSHIFSLEKEQLVAQKARDEDIKDYENEIDELEEELLRHKSVDYSDEIVEIEVQIAGYSEDIKTLDKYKTQKSNLESEINVCSKEIRVLGSNIDKKEKELEDIISGKNVPKTCSQCGQDLPLKDTSHLQNHIKDAIKELRESRVEQYAEREVLETLLNKLDNKITTLGNVADKVDELKSKRAELDKLTTVANSKKASIVSSLERAKKRLAKLQNEDVTDSYTQLINKSKKAIEKHQNKLKSLSKELNEISYQQQDLSFWVDSFGNQGIKSLLLDSVTPFLNERANYYLAKLADSTIAVKFNTQQTLKSGEKRDKFSVEVINESGDNSYKGNSGGEKRRIDVAVNMALQDLINSRSNKSVDLIVYDEVYEGLDSAGCEQVVELLKEKARQFGSVVVITHNDNLKQLFDNSLTVYKENSKTFVLKA